MKCAIVAGSGPAVGLGHVSRCLALAQAFEEVHGRKPVFLGLEDSARRWIAERGFASLARGAGRWNLLIADSYALSRADLAALRRRSDRLLVIQDAVPRPAACDWLLNSTVYAHRLDHSVVEAGGYLLGPSFQPLRREFWSRTAPRPARRVADVLVTLGGSDVDALLGEILPVLKGSLDGVRFHVAVGPHSKGALPLWPGAILHRSPADFLGLIQSCDAAVSAGGQALYELAYAGVPTIGFEIADNQTPNVTGFARAGAIVPLPRARSRGFAAGLRRSLRALAEDGGRRQAMADAGRRLIDGQGALRVIRALSLDARGRK